MPNENNGNGVGDPPVENPIDSEGVHIKSVVGGGSFEIFNGKQIPVDSSTRSFISERIPPATGLRADNSTRIKKKRKKAGTRPAKSNASSK